MTKMQFRDTGIYYVITIISDVCLLLVFELLFIYCVADYDDYETGRKMMGQLYIFLENYRGVDNILTLERRTLRR